MLLPASREKALITTDQYTDTPDCRIGFGAWVSMHGLVPTIEALALSKLAKRCVPGAAEVLSMISKLRLY
eukprot:5206891-Amphidinium_carterae.3